LPLLPRAYERLYIRLALGPTPLLDLMNRLAWETVVGAVRLGVFDALASGPQTPAQVARRIDADEHAVRMLLDTLVGLNYVRRRGGRYVNTRMGRWNVSGETSLAPAFEFWDGAITSLLGNAAQTIRTGKQSADLYAWLAEHPAMLQKHQAYLIAVTKMSTWELLRRIRLPAGSRRLLDVGGGHAKYSVAFCRRYPELKAVVFDAPEALEVTRASIAAEGMTDRISTREGDFLSDGMGDGYDVALLFNVAHGLSAAENIRLVQRTADALRPGGTILVLDQFAGGLPSPTSTATSRLLALTYLHSLGGGIYSADEVGRWFAAAGVRRTRKVPLLSTPGSSVVVGIKAAS
jgi:SAM-dependent methyltransferase